MFLQVPSIESKKIKICLLISNLIRQLWTWELHTAFQRCHISTDLLKCTIFTPFVYLYTSLIFVSNSFHKWCSNSEDINIDIHLILWVDFYLRLQMTIYSKEVSVLMPGEEMPTFIAHPAPAPCPPEHILKPPHHQKNPSDLHFSSSSSVITS